MIDELSLLYCRVIHQIGAVKTQPVRKFKKRHCLRAFRIYSKPCQKSDVENF